MLQSYINFAQELRDKGVLEHYQPYHATRADLLRRSGHKEDSAVAYRHALELPDNTPAQRFLKQRIAQVLE